MILKARPIMMSRAFLIDFRKKYNLRFLFE